MAELYERLRELRDSDIYPFHMPGHKRRWEQSPLREMLGIDITEIDGFDNLHHATGILKTMQEEAAAVYGAERTFFLVNGSTCGIQAAVSASVKEGKKLLMARNCHKAVYNTCLLRRIDAVYLYPSETDMPFLCGGISPQAVEEAFTRNDEIDAVILTSPNYDGVVSDVASIADIVHAHGAVLIVDEAHGAHLPFSTYFPKSAVRCGADIVIHSLHKTLPSPTQTALLHVNGDRVDAGRLRELLAMYQTSSPSYVFMAAMQQCIEETAAKGDKWLSALSERLDAFVRACSSLTHIRLLSRDWALRNGIFDFDKSKILIFPQNCGLNGEQLYEILLRRYHLQMEMASAGYVMGIAAVCDTDEGFARLLHALKELDEELARTDRCTDRETDRQTVFPAFARSDEKCAVGIDDEPVQQLPLPERVVPVYEAYDMPRRKCPIADAAGEISAEFAYVYPPGIPMVVPGERITGALIGQLVQYREMGLPLQGLRDDTCKTIQVIRFDL